MAHRLSRRLDAIEPFYVMEMAKVAHALAAGPACDPAQGGRPMIYLNIGEPDFSAAPAVVAAAKACLDAGTTAYTQATGLPELRQRLSRWYGQRWGQDIDPGRIVLTAGASAALQLICTALFEPGDEVLMPDPSYPCNRHFVSAVGANPRLLPAGPKHRFQLDAESVKRHWSPQTRGVLLASPSNPTGTSIDPAEMRAIVEFVRSKGGVTLVDEIYLGLSYDSRYGRSALACGDDVISINSFSKYFAMTGWRLGWLVLPADLVAPVERLAQRAALACFEPESLSLYEQRRGEFARRRDVMLRALAGMGLPVPVEPDGAFYAWANCSAQGGDSWALCHRLMEQAQIVLTPGRDFGPAGAEAHLRLSYASALPLIEEAMRRLRSQLDTGA